MSGTGDKSRLLEVQDRLLDQIRLGAFRKHAAAHVGISERTMKNWMRWGQRDNAKEPYASFAKKVLEAEGFAVNQASQTFFLAATQDWKAAKAFLAIKAPTEWGDQVRKSVKEHFETMLQVVEDTLGKDNAALVYEELARRLSNPSREGAQDSDTGGEGDRPLH